MTTYKLCCLYRETTLAKTDLQFWEADRIKQTAKEIVTRRAGVAQNLNFSSIHVRELRDAVDRAAEDLSTRPDEDLDYYWNARRGVPTYYAPLFLGVQGKAYLKSASLQCVGEGLALYLLEDRKRHPNLFDLDLSIRPLGATPDLMMRYRSDPSRIALVEAKSTETKSLESKVVQATEELIRVFQGWQAHEDLKRTNGFAVATSVFDPGT